MEEGRGGPFAALIVKDSVVLARGQNRVAASNDPTAHAEVVAIRLACQQLQNFRLDDCQIYVNCEPCPMCLAAIYWSGIATVYYAADKEDAAAIGFRDAMIAAELRQPPPLRQVKMIQMLRAEALPIFRQWADMTEKVAY